MVKISKNYMLDLAPIESLNEIILLRQSISLISMELYAWINIRVL